MLKSPGISLKDQALPDDVIISSQTDLFLSLFGAQVVGITGTKGKSTTSSLLYHLLNELGQKAFLVGNIGVPALDIVGELEKDSWVVYEMSSHQLQYSRYSPHVAILLNLHQEHLDHYEDYRGYRQAKWQITAHQRAEDFFVFNADNATLQEDLMERNLASQLISVSLCGEQTAYARLQEDALCIGDVRLSFDTKQFKLHGKHNIFNLMVCLSTLHKLGFSVEEALQDAYTFNGLAHRLQFVGEYKGISFYNDSIATIPEATMNALKAVPKAQTLILGGYDRGIDYTSLMDFLLEIPPLNLILMGKVGERIHTLLKQRNYPGKISQVEDMKAVVQHAFACTPRGGAVLLSPAAASYDAYENFEERGTHFMHLLGEKE